MGLGVIVIANDFTALNVALPAMEEDFDVDVGTVQWASTPTCSSSGWASSPAAGSPTCSAAAGSSSSALAFFAGFSVVGALAPNALVLIGARVGMGVGGALMWPAVLGMTFAALPPERAGLAGGLVLGVAGLGNAIGPLLGGILTDEFSWRAIFWVNVPIAVFAGSRSPRSSTSRRSRRPSGGSTTPGSPPSRSAWSRSCSASTRASTGAGPTPACSRCSGSGSSSWRRSR